MSFLGAVAPAVQLPHLIGRVGRVDELVQERAAEGLAFGGRQVAVHVDVREIEDPVYNSFKEISLFLFRLI